MTETCLPIVQWLKNWFTSTDDLIDKTYPIGSIYMSVNSTSPSTLFGGTWVQLTDTFLYATSTTADTGTTAPTGQGEATHSLTQSEMPRHNHSHNLSFSSGSGSSYAYTQTNNRAITQLNTGYTGGSGTSQSASNGVAHNNMPPYLKVFMWKRTA